MSALSLLAIALGVALGLAVHLIHGAALDRFGRGIAVAGKADHRVVGAARQVRQALFATLARRPKVAAAGQYWRIERACPGARRAAFSAWTSSGCCACSQADAAGRGRRVPCATALRPGVCSLSDDARQRLSAPGRSMEGEVLPPALVDARIAWLQVRRCAAWCFRGGEWAGGAAQAACSASWTSAQRSGR